MNELEKYIKESKPKWYEWIPLVSINYETRMNNYIRTMQNTDDTKKTITEVFGKMLLVTLGLPLILSLVTPAMNMIARSIVIRKLSKLKWEK